MPLNSSRLRFDIVWVFLRDRGSLEILTTHEWNSTTRNENWKKLFITEERKYSLEIELERNRRIPDIYCSLLYDELFIELFIELWLEEEEVAY